MFWAMFTHLQLIPKNVLCMQETGNVLYTKPLQRQPLTKKAEDENNAP